jgi:hypothetical protein
MNYILNLEMWLVISLLWLELPATALDGRIIYVDTDATGVNDGSSWDNAYKYLQDALAAAIYGDDIHVAQGIYTPDRGVGVTAGDARATFSLKNGVAVRGGFAGHGEPDPNTRDFVRYETTLSGDLAGDDVNVTDLRGLLTDSRRAGNSYTVVTCRETDSNTILDGLTVTGGHCMILIHFPPGSSAAGMYNCSASPTVINCTFTGNATLYSGGGIYNGEGSNPTLINCVFTRNYASGRGAAMANVSDSNPKLINCTFTDNYASWDEMLGGAMFNCSSNPTLTNCIFERNSGSAMYNLMSSPMLQNCIFVENSAYFGGGICNENSSSVRLHNCTFMGNSAEHVGGGISDSNSTIILIDCVFRGNSARIYGGGGIAAYDSSQILINCIFSGNSAFFGGGVMNTFSNLTLSNCTFSGNLAQKQGGGILNHSPYMRLTNCILWNNEDEIDDAYGLMTQITYSNVQGGWPGEGNIDADPCFVESGYWDPNGTWDNPNDDFWVDGDYHLKSQAGRWEPVSQSWVKDNVTSPCIDAGDPMSPIGYEPFPNGGRINMGAYGGSAEASKSYFGEPICKTIIAGDINGDCKVDFKDLALLATHWIANSSP